MVFGEAKLEARAQHARALDPAHHADRDRDVLARNIGARRRENALHARTRIRRATDDLHGLAIANIDHTDAQTIRIRMLLGGDHIGGDIGRKFFGRIFHTLDLEANFRQTVDNRVK